MADQLQTRVYSIIKPEDNLSQPTIHKGKYGNPWDSWGGIIGLGKVLKWQIFGTRPQMPKESKLDQMLPIVVPDMEAIMKPTNPDKIQITWIGHSTFLVQVDGLNFLTDPVWSDRCSPVAFAGPKRYRDVPFKIKDLPKIDFVLISHNHYDHLDSPSVEKLHKLQQPNAPVWVVPLGVASWFRNTLKGPLNIVELGWWDCVPLNDKIDVIGTPAQHWSKRSPTDDFCSLWGGFVVTSKQSGKKIYFAGDTGYCTAFKEIGQKFGSFDLALIPIGAYHPRDLMRNQHVDPREAVQIHKDINSKQSIGMHWGTFVLTDEQLLDPKTDLAAVLEEEKIEPDVFTTLHHGETRSF